MSFSSSNSSTNSAVPFLPPVRPPRGSVVSPIQVVPGFRNLAPPPSISTTSDAHLVEALKLSLNAVKRFKREGRMLSTEEVDLAKELFDLTSGVTTVGITPRRDSVDHPFTNFLDAGDHNIINHGSPLMPTAPTTGGALSGGESSGDGSDTSQARAKRRALKKARRSMHRLSIYEKMVSSKADIAGLTDFTLRCSAVQSIEELCNITCSAIEASDSKVAATFFLQDAGDEELLVDPVGGEVSHLKLADLKTSLAEQVNGAGRERANSTSSCASNGSSTSSISSGFVHSQANSFVLPLKVDMETPFGLCMLRSKLGGESPVLQDKSEDQLKQLDALVGIASMTFRNLRLFDHVKWQVGKAEAMLTMANQLSRDNLNEEVLVKSIITTARELTESDRCAVFLVKGPNLQAYFEDGTSVKMPSSQGLAGHVATTGETLNISDAYEDSRFNKAVDKATGYRTKTMLCMPVRYEGAIVAVAQLINKLPHPQNKAERKFSKRDEESFVTFSTLIGVCLRNCRVNADLQLEKRKSELLLDCAKDLAESDIRDFDSIVNTVLHGAKDLLVADRVSLFLIDKEHDQLYSKIADATGGQEIRFPIGTGIAGTVAQTGISENIEDAYGDSRFNQEFDKKLGYRTKSILCQPIVCQGEVLAVAQLVNKLDSVRGTVTVFSAQDELSFRSFATFAGITLNNAQLLQFAVQAGEEAMALSLNRHTTMAPDPCSLSIRGRQSSMKKVSDATIGRVKDLAHLVKADLLASAKTRQFDLFKLRDMIGPAQSADAAALFVSEIIWDTGLPEKAGCDKDVLLYYVLACKAKYRSVPYHNFFHAVDCVQTLITFLYEGKVIDMLTDLEAFTILITALAHDLDHMGVNNSFHMKTDSPLGMLSSASGNKSVLEVHHCNLAIEILEDPLANVFSGITDSSDQAGCYRMLIDCILATDMARHAELMATFDEVKEMGYDKKNKEHRKIACQMVMKFADISNVTKPFHVSRLWAISVTEEFYKQGDMEKQKGVDVLPMFDRSKAGELAQGQIGFINFVAKKFFICAVGLMTGMQFALDGVNANVDEWQQLLDGARPESAIEEIVLSIK